MQIYAYNSIIHSGGFIYNDVKMGARASQITSFTIVILNRLFRRRSKKTSKLRVTGLCAGNSPGTGEFPAQMASNAENVSIWSQVVSNVTIRSQGIAGLTHKSTWNPICRIFERYYLCATCIFYGLRRYFQWNFIGYWEKILSNYRSYMIFYDTKGHFKFLYVALYYRCTKCNFRCIALYSLDYAGHRQRSYQITGAM